MIITEDNRDIVCRGALTAYRITHHELWASAVYAQAGASEPWIFRLSDDEDVVKIVALDDRHLLVVGDCQTLVTVDIVDQVRLAETSAFDSVRRYSVTPSRDGEYVFLGSSPPRLLSTRTLEIAHTYADLSKVHQVALREDGGFVIIADIVESQHSTIRSQLAIAYRDGALAIQRPHDERGEPVRSAQLAGSVSKLSPCGRWVIRQYIGSVTLRGADQLTASTRISRFFRSGSHVGGQSLYTLPELQAARIDQFAELWSVDPFRLIRRIRVGDCSIDDLTQQKLTGESPFAHKWFKNVEKELERARTTDENSVPSLVGRLNGLNASKLAYDWGNEALCAISRAAELRSFDEWRPDDVPLETMLPDDIPGKRWVQHLPRLQKSFFWANDGNSFSVLLDNGVLVHADILGNELSAKPWVIPTWPRPPESAQAAVYGFLEELLEITIQVDGFDAGGCAAAIDKMATRLAEGIKSLSHKGRLRFRFKSPDRLLSEPEFFTHVSEHCPDARGALQRMWQVFSHLPFTRAAAVGDCFYNENAGALAHAAVAFARLDPMAFRDLATWFRYRLPEREQAGRELVLPAIAKTNGWSSQDAVSFGLWSIVNEEIYGPHFAVYELAQGILQSARRLFTTSEIVKEVNSVVQSFDLPGNPDAVGHARASLRTLLYPRGVGESLWDRHLAKELESQPL
ncbi:MAG: hypothetical protein WC816_11015 [Sphingomonas sp.]|jgi:hypothetical protein